jgi:hypothetical protein
VGGPTPPPPPSPATGATRTVVSGLQVAAADGTPRHRRRGSRVSFRAAPAAATPRGAGTDSGAGAVPTGELELPVQRADTPDEDGTATDNTGEDGSGANETGTENRSETDSGGETAASAGGSLQQLGRGVDELFDNAHANNTRRGRGGRGRGGTRPSRGRGRTRTRARDT